MELSKQTVVDQITISENGTVFVRETSRIIENGQVISSQYVRSTFAPGDDVSAAPAQVQQVCAVFWTPEVIAAYRASLIESV